MNVTAQRNPMDKYDEIYLLIQQAGYKDWCTACGSDPMTTHCNNSNCQDRAQHENHCHEHLTELCIPRDLKVKHWLDCDCP